MHPIFTSSGALWAFFLALTDLTAVRCLLRRVKSSTFIRSASGVASIGPGLAFARPLIRQNSIHSKEEEQEEPKSLPPGAFPGLQICRNCCRHLIWSRVDFQRNQNYH